MERAKVQILPLFMAFLVLASYMECQPVPRPPLSPRPLCVSQFALVNNACLMLPINPLPAPPAPPVDDDDDDDDNDNDNERPRHRRRHRHRHIHQETPVEADCCRWLKEVDNECVCELLVHMPLFLSRPAHAYTVTVDPSCNVTFACGGRLRA